MPKSLYAAAALTALILLSACSDPAPQTAEDMRNQIRSACEDQYNDEGTQAVADCELRQALKRAEKREDDKERRVDAAAGQ